MSNNAIKVAVEVNEKSFLPEAYAYRDYFISQGLQCDLVDKRDPRLLKYDCAILFHGFHPFWKKYPKLVIGEYHSLSTGRFNRIKDIFKRLLNVRPDLYIFLNDDVRKKLWINKGKKYITRGMGYSAKDFEAFSNQEKKYDVVYCGSYREGVCDAIKKLADLGLTVAVVGAKINFKHDLITSFGRKKPTEARRIIAQAKYGLNYTPDVFPLNIQDSTKIIEYCAAGLGVITNRYHWVDKFEKDRSAKFLDIGCITNADFVHSYNFVTPDVSDLEWDKLIKSSGIVNFINVELV